MKSELMVLLNPDGVLVCDNAASHTSEFVDFMNYFNISPDFAPCLVPVSKKEFVF